MPNRKSVEAKKIEYVDRMMHKEEILELSRSGWEIISVSGYEFVAHCENCSKILTDATDYEEDEEGTCLCRRCAIKEVEHANTSK